ncbi:MAG: Do family serine endopeptidase [Geminicoccaceae bacterium]
MDDISLAKRRNLGRVRAVALAGVAVAALLIGAPVAFSDSPQPANANVRNLDIDKGYADLVAAIEPAVVNVSVEKTIDEADASGRGGPNMDDPEMRRFFERFFGQMPDNMPQRMPQGERQAHGEGSGFIISADGLIVTNAHVAGDASKVEVTLQTGEKFPATVKGIDEKTDLALLKIEAGKPLAFVEFADSSKVRVGDRVLAIGNPFGLGGTVTSGIVSATGREIGQGPYEDFLQVDAPINHGNSGGPTFNTQGEVVGVNTAIFSPSGGSIGIGFAISSNLAKEVIADLMDDGKVERGWLGVAIQQMDEDIAASLGVKEPKGALVAKVEPDSPAAAAGLQARDVIVGFGDKKIDTVRDLTRAVAATPANTEAQIKVWRGGKEETLEAKISMQPSGEQVASADEPAASDQPRLGLGLAEVPPEMRERLGLADGTGGVLVQRVLPDSPAESKGIRAGDVVLEVGGNSVSTPQQVVDAVKSAHDTGAKAVLMLLQRNGQPTYEAIPFATS